MADISNQIRQHVLFLQQQIGETSDEYDRIKEVHEAFTMEYCEFTEKSKQLETYIQSHGEQYPNVKSLKASKEALQKSVQQKVGFKLDTLTILISSSRVVYVECS